MTTSLILPPPLAPGDLIGVVAPASPPDRPEKIEQALARLVAAGFQVKTGKYLAQRNGYLAGTDEERAHDFNAAFADPEVKGILALRGGYGSCRMLPMIDYAAIRAHPKLFMGYSDITALHVAILQKAGVATLHGPNTSEAFLPENSARCLKALTGPVASGDIVFSRADHPAVHTLVAGNAKGRLIGGNMTCLLRLLGTPFAPDFTDALLFLEDTTEKAYRVDGLFTQLHLSGAVAKISGLILGQFDHPDPAECERIQACLQREAVRLGVPCVCHAPIGHFSGQVIVPHGVPATLDADAGNLRIAEAI